MRFYAFRTEPVCSPSRASLITGRHVFRHGVGTVVSSEHDGVSGAGGLAEFGDAEFAAPSIVQTLQSAGIRTAIVGKVHLSTWTSQQFVHNPGRMGSGWQIMDRIASPETFLGTQLRNLNQLPVPNGGASFDGGYYNYYSNDGFDNSNRHAQTEYSTSWQVDQAITFFQSLGAGQRGFCLLGSNACHSPFGVGGQPPDPGRDFPPAGMVSTEEYAQTMLFASEAGQSTTWPQYMASLEALDAELGRLLSSIPPRVRSGLSILVLGDNGVEPSITDARLQWGKDFGPDWNRLFDDHGTDRLKGSVYHWGSTTCAFWSGPGRRARNLPTAGTATWAMADMVDVAATAADYFGVSCPPGDGVSFLPVVYEGVTAHDHARQATLSETYWPCGNWRQIQTGDGPDEHLERGYHRRLDGAAFTNGIGGRFSLVRTFSAGVWHDELYRLNAEDDTPVDLFEFDDLILQGGFEEQYATMLADLTTLLDSTL